MVSNRLSKTQQIEGRTVPKKKKMRQNQHFTISSFKCDSDVRKKWTNGSSIELYFEPEQPEYENALKKILDLCEPLIEKAEQHTEQFVTPYWVLQLLKNKETCRIKQ